MTFGELGLTWQLHNSRTICWFTRIKAVQWWYYCFNTL